MLHLNRMRNYFLEVITFIFDSLKYFVLNMMKGCVCRVSMEMDFRLTLPVPCADISV